MTESGCGSVTVRKLESMPFGAGKECCVPPCKDSVAWTWVAGRSEIMFPMCEAHSELLEADISEFSALAFPASPASVDPGLGCPEWQTSNDDAEPAMCTSTIVAVIKGIPMCDWCLRESMAGNRQSRF